MKEDEKFFEEQDITVITQSDVRYPSALKNLSNPPEALYCKGNIDLLTRPAVGIVGTRDCTRYGYEVSKRFGKQLADHGIVVVSGLAEGIDAAAHHGALAGTHAQGGTIAVLGNGINIFFPQSNTELQRTIFERGLVISEYPPNYRGGKYTFPQRNRIIAALSRAVIIVEADIRSGAHITKEHALDLGVDVFAVPGNITSYASRGTNAIIKESQCAIITDISDVLSLFGTIANVNEESHQAVQISFEAKTVLDAIGKEDAHFDDIITKTNFAAKTLAALLTSMEMDGLIKKLPGNFYVKN